MMKDFFHAAKKFSLKKRIFSLFIFSLLAIIASCSQITSVEEEQEPSSVLQTTSGYCSFRLSLGEDSARAVFPTSPYDKTALYYKLSYLNSDAALVNFPADGSGINYATLTAETFTLPIGEYLFSLDAYTDSDCAKKVLECTKQTTLTAASTSLELQLISTGIVSTADSSAVGEVSVTMTFPSSVTVTKVTAELVKSTDTPTGTGQELTISTSGSTNSVTYSKSDVASGIYIVYFTLSGDGIEATVIPELVVVATGKTSSNESSPIALTEDLINKTGSVIYVSTNGNDVSGNGTESAPFATLSRAITMINTQNNATTDWAIKLDGDFGGANTIPETLPAKSLTITGMNYSSSSGAQDGFWGPGENASGTLIPLTIASSIPVTLEKLYFSNGSSGIQITGTGKVTIVDSGINNNRRGILISGNADVSIKNSLVANNALQDNTNGAGILKTGSGTLKISNSTVENNTNAANGGGIYAGNGSLIIEDNTKIQNNIAATGNGGGIYISGTFTMTDGTISGNNGNGSNSRGGGVYLKEGTFTMGGGTISGNYATGSGGGVCIEANGKFFMYGASVIGDASKRTEASSSAYSNFTGASGGGIYANNGSAIYLGYSDEATEAELTGGIYYNYSASSAVGGGGINTGEELNMTSGTIAYNSANNRGGGLYIQSQSKPVTISGGSITGNSSVTGGAIYLYNGTFTMSGTASIPAGSGDKNDVYLASGKTITVGGTLSESPAATITPQSYTAGTQVLGGTAALLASEHEKFAVADDASGNAWKIDNAGKLQKQVSGGITITVPEYTNKDINLTQSGETADSITFTVDEGYTSYSWTVGDDDQLSTTNTLTISKSLVSTAGVWIMAVASDGTNYYDAKTFVQAQ